MELSEGGGIKVPGEAPIVYVLLVERKSLSCRLLTLTENAT